MKNALEISTKKEINAPVCPNHLQFSASEQGVHPWNPRDAAMQYG